MQATHFRMAEGVDAGLTNSAVRLLSWVRMGSKLVVSFATDGAAAEVGALRFEGFEGGPREEWIGFLMIFCFFIIAMLVEKMMGEARAQGFCPKFRLSFVRHRPRHRQPPRVQQPTTANNFLLAVRSFRLPLHLLIYFQR